MSYKLKMIHKGRSRSHPARKNLTELERVQRLRNALLEFRPELDQVLKPATSTEIDELERLRGAPLPAWYRCYLGSMAYGLGEFTYFQLADLNFEWVMRRMRHGKAKLKQYQLIGISPENSGWDVYLDLGETGDGVGVVTIGWSDEGDDFHVEPLASRFSTYVLLTVIMGVREAMPRRYEAHGPVDTASMLDEVSKVLLELGLLEHELSGLWDRVYRGAKCMVIAHELGGRPPLTISIGCADQEVCSHIVGNLERELGLDFKRKSR